ncbi:MULTISPECIES: peptide deformylase [Streptomyces]|uniref:Peptide deformylase n=1 Tax=Streptomyces griseiscabiei TaxID=2993540 RepID=A0ABU4L4C4_9ACTN|nr:MULTISPECIES: peptide deformylase [Streptomyces]MBZ3905460.1 peptide deformylase [Streptomyces griseiscabiei]MDX2910551.1 peptide deformylase [Streptomyces griseiscabiei]
MASEHPTASSSAASARERAESRPLSDRVEELLAHEGPLPIVAAGDPVLRRTAEPFDGQLDPGLLARFVAALRATMHAAPGVGLAAPQVGVSLRIAVIEDPAPVPEEIRLARGRVPQPFRVLVNPAYEAVGTFRDPFYEGCLSVPGWQAVVSRYAKVRLRALDEHGRAVDEEFSGWPARIVQHETDHLNGTLYLDHAELRSLSSNQAMADRWNDPTPARAARELGFLLPD